MPEKRETMHRCKPSVSLQVFGEHNCIWKKKKKITKEVFEAPGGAAYSLVHFLLRRSLRQLQLGMKTTNMTLKFRVCVVCLDGEKGVNFKGNATLYKLS